MQQYTHKDMRYLAFEVGHKVMRAVMRGHSPALRIQVVTKIDSEGIYLDNSPKVIQCPNRLYILGR